MSRPGPDILLEHFENDATVQVCDATAVYAVLYQGKPIKIRKFTEGVRYLGFKYGKTSFPEPGHAIRLARELNEVYGCEDFTVGVMQPMRIIGVDYK